MTSYRYDKAGRLIGMTRPNGTSCILTLNKDGETRRRTDANGTSLISAFEYTRDNAGQITEEVVRPAPHGYPQIFGSGTYDADNRLITWDGGAVSSDADGNMTQLPGLNCVYNSRNQMSYCENVTFLHDAEGQRVGFTMTSLATKYTIDTNAALSRLLITEVPGGTQTYYVYGLGLLYEVNGVGTGSETTKTHHYNEVGSTVARTNDAGAVIGRVEYTAYGSMTYSEGDMSTPFLYNGAFGVMTGGNGLLYMRARYYSPKLMRFLNPDPIGFSGGTNWFAYADGNPISKLDPFGLWTWKQTWGVVKMIGGIAEAAVGASVGVAASWTGVGAVAGGAVALHGLDTIQAGFRQAVSGEDVDTGTSLAIQSAGVSRRNANLIDAGLGLASGGAGIFNGVAKTAQIVKLPEAAGMTTVQALQAWDKGSRALNTADFLALGGTATNALQKAAAMEKIVLTTTPIESFVKSLQLWNTGLTPLADIGMGAAVIGESAARLMK